MSGRRVAKFAFHIDIRVLEQQDKPDDFVRRRAVEELNAWGLAAAARDEAMPPGWRYVVESPEDIKIRWLHRDGPLTFETYQEWWFLCPHETGARILARAEMVAIESEQARARRRGEAWDSLRHELSEGQLFLPTNPELIRRVSEEPVLDGGNDIWSRVASAMRTRSVPAHPNPGLPLNNFNRGRFMYADACYHDRAYFGDARYHDPAYSSIESAMPSVRSHLFDRALFFERAQPAPWSMGALHRWTVHPYMTRSLLAGGKRWKIVRWRSRRRPWETWCEVVRPPLDYAATTDRMAGRALFGVEHPWEFGDFAGLCDKEKNRPENLARNRRLLLQVGADKFAYISNERPGVLS